MRQHQQQFAELNVACLVVTFEALAQARRYVDEFQIDWPLLVDEKRGIYQVYGLEPRASLWNLFRPTFWPYYISLMMRGRRVRRPTGDVHQMGGDVLIDPEGVVRFFRGSQTPLDRPTPEELLGVIRSRTSHPPGGENAGQR